MSLTDSAAIAGDKSSDGAIAAGGYGKKVFGYLTFGDTKWTSSSSGKIPVDSLPWDVLTHATLFAASGSVPIPNSYLVQLPYLAARAHQSGVFAGLCYGGSGDAPLISTVNTPSSWGAWINYNLSLIDDYGIDFLEFDFEGSVTASNVYGFFDVLYDSLQVRQSSNDPSVPPFIVLTVGPSRAASWVSLQPFVGHVNLMSYDYVGDWWGRIIHDFSPKSYQNWNGTGLNLDYYAPIGASNGPAPSMQQAAIRVRNAGWASDKIVVGFDANPTYWSGGSFPGGRGPTYIRQPTSGNTATAGSNPDFSSEWPAISAIHPDSIHFDQIAQTYWAHTGTSLSDDKLWVFGALPGRDSAVWATRQVVDSMNIGGVMFWNLGNEIWNTSTVPPGGRGWFFSQIRKHFAGVAGPPPPPDLTPPGVDLTNPAAGDTVSGTVQVYFSASDASGISIVKFMVDGVFTGASDASPPYSFSWNSTTVADGPHTVGAEATDGAGLKNTAGIQVNVKNAPAPPPPPPDTAAVSVYTDALASPWVNASWGAVNTFSSAERVYDGSYAIRSVQNGWGAISVHSGNWSSPVALNTSGFDSLQFAVYPETTGLSLAVSLENDASGALPAVVKSNLPTGRWTQISIPMSALNPGGQLVHRLNIQNNTSQTRVYHVDRIVLGADTVATGATPLSAPSLGSPAHGAIDQELEPQLSWNAVPGATSYQVQVALDPLFSATIVDAQAVAETSFQPGSLVSGTVYYWRVRANGAGAQSDYSETFAFTTSAVTVEALKYDRLFVDFGKVPIGTEKTDSVLIENNGPSQRNIIGISTSSNVFAAIAGGLTIPPGGSQKLFIRYKPTRKTRDASRVISVIDSTNRIDTVRVVGNGVNAPRQGNRGKIVFSDIPAEEDGTQDLFVTNDGDLDLQISSVTSTQDGISVSPSTATIAPHDSLRFAVTVSSRGKSGKISGYLIFSNNGLAAKDSVLVEATLAGAATGSTIPEEFSLSQNYPNPFNPTTTIGFGLPHESRVTVRVYNVFGQEVKTVFEGELGAGYGSVEWDGRNDAGATLASGLYFYRIEAVATDGPGAAFMQSKRMLLIK